jgi:hypothetical protein
MASVIPHLGDFKRDKVQVHINKDAPTPQVNVYYVQGKTKTPLHLKVFNWTCPFGRDDRDQLVAIIPDELYFDLEALDKLGKDICKMFYTELTGKDLDPDEDIPYKSLIHKDDGLDTVHLSLSPQTRVFDNNNVKLGPEQITQYTSGQFSANFLLSFACISVYNDYFFWSLLPSQIKVKKYCTLPEGCIIFEEEALLQQELETRRQVQVTTKVQDEPVADFDPDVNELID